MVNIAKIYANSSAQYEYEFAYSALLRVIIGQGQKKLPEALPEASQFFTY